MPGGLGIVVLHDCQAGAPLGKGASLRAIQRPSEGGEQSAPEPKAPKAFEWKLDDYIQ